MRRIVTLLALLALVAAGCGGESSDEQGGKDGTEVAGESGSEESDDDGADSSGDEPDEGSSAPDQDFCDAMVAFSESGATSDAPTEEDLDDMRELRDQAPDEIKDALDTIIELAEEFDSLPEDDPESLDKMSELAFDPDVIAAGLEIEEYLTEECGIDPDELGGDEGFDSGEESDAPTGDSPAGEGLEIDAIEAHLEESYAGSDWVELLTSWAIFGTEISAGAAFEPDLTSAQAVEACAAILDFALAIEPEATVSVVAVDTTTVLASGAADSPCEAG